MELFQVMSEHLRASAKGFLWAVEQVPEERLFLCPPNPRWLGEWTAARHVFHVLYYEQEKLLPFIKKSANIPSSTSIPNDEENAWRKTNQDIKSILSTFHSARENEVIPLLASFDEKMWDLSREEEAWGPISLRWIVTKAYQHTCQHTHDILQLALFWDCAAYKEMNPPE
ncbi:DinB family protein [Tengunoibacter tsumagoiensis]|uniref:DinB-like domain-containing protein n=1 Tax=Tengunoibacter tsumagoiensis TaxID=2014871 RepID=A0A401ZZW2_9CHLR|nr:DinB family protein [Tengunoibacter tsumagoiensis]GCE12394.1 hypothetical protein KTT_22530 [Tengunoibacter tsumagoiensis]